MLDKHINISGLRAAAAAAAAAMRISTDKGGEFLSCTLSVFLSLSHLMSHLSKDAKGIQPEVFFDRSIDRQHIHL